MALSVIQQLGIHQTSSPVANNPINVPVTSNATTGNLAVLVIRAAAFVGSITGVTDTDGHEWTQVIPLGGNSTSGQLSVWTAPIGESPATGPLKSGDSVQVTGANANAGTSALLLEVGPDARVIEPNPPLTSHASNTSVSPSVTPNATGDLVLALIGLGENTVTVDAASVTAGWSSGWITASGDYILAASAFENATAGTLASITWDIQTASTSTTAMLVFSSLPLADAGSDQVVTPGDTVTLDGSGSTGPNGISSYSWDCLSGPDGGNTLSGETATYTASLGTDVWQLTIDDSTGQTATDTVTVTCGVNVVRVWDGSVVTTARRLTLSPDGTVN